LIVAVLALALAGQPAHARPKELTVWTARALATVLDEVGPEFTRETGYALVVRSDLPNGFLERARAGEPFDVFITAAKPLDEWIRDGRVVAASRTELARSGIGVAVKAGGPKPDIRTVEAFKQTLLKAKSVAYLHVGSGLHLHGLLERWNITDEIGAKSIRPGTDIVARLVADGEVEIGVVVITQILTTPGVELAGPLPPEIQSYITFVGGVGTKSAEPEGSAKLISFLKSSRATAVIQAQGMEK
jgi:molybdate transport system substrate-binding protein